MNLTVLENNEILAETNFTVETEWYYGISNSAYLYAGDFSLRYWPDDNEATVRLYYSSDETDVLNRFWERYAYYFDLNEADLENEKQHAEYSVSYKDSLVESIHIGEPIWERVFADFGDLVVNDSSSVGEIDLKFDSGATAFFHTNNLVLKNEIPYKTGSILYVTFSIDEDSDIELEIFCDNHKEENKLEEDPATYFESLFEVLDLPISLDEFEFVEHYVEGL